MRKGERTKEHVVKVAAGVMNRHGWLSTPVQAITQATGLTKGGLYNHFDSLRSLSEQAFSYATRRLIAMVDQHTTMPGSAEARLLALLAAFDWVAGRKPPFDAGCPLLNAAIEIDDVDEAYRAEVVAVSAHIQDAIAGVIAQGVASGEFRCDLAPSAQARFLFAAFEGGVMLAGLHRDGTILHEVKANLATLISSWTVTRTTSP